MAAAKAQTGVEKRTLVVYDNRGKFQIEIPADWKVTFGTPMGNRGFESQGRELRIYEAENKQRACFTGVLVFFDTSIPIRRETVTEEGEVLWSEGPDGYSSTKKVTKKRTVVEDSPF